MLSLYQLKPKFQALLRPFVSRLAKLGVTANQVTLLALIISLLIGTLIFFLGTASPVLFLLIPIWMLLRMALNAIDGMLAKEFNQQSALGAYLNELSDVLSDSALYLPFSLIAPFTPGLIFAVIFAACFSELCGVMAHAIGAQRKYDGPMGKSDRALVFGILGLWISTGSPLPSFSQYLLAALILLVAYNCINRIRSALNEVK